MTTLIDECRALGIELWANDGRLCYRTPPGALGPDLRRLLQQHKTELVALLTPAVDTYALEERQAIQADEGRTLEDLGLAETAPGTWEHPSVFGLDFGDPPG